MPKYNVTFYNEFDEAARQYGHRVDHHTTVPIDAYNESEVREAAYRYADSHSNEHRTVTPESWVAQQRNE